MPDIRCIGICTGGGDAPGLNAVIRAAVKAAIESGLADLEPLMKPVFYQDNSNTFFVEPSVAEQTVEEWQEWVAPTPQPGSIWQDPNWWKEIWLVPEIPWKPPIPDPVDPLRILIDPGSLFKPITGNDWLANPGTVLVFDGSLIGPTGQSGLELLPAGDLSDRGSPVKVFSGSGLAPGSTVVLSGNATLKQAGLKRLDGGLNVVGGGGFNSALKENFDVSNRSGLGSGGFGAGGLGG